MLPYGKKKNTLDYGVYHRCVLIITSRLEKVVLMPRERERERWRESRGSQLPNYRSSFSSVGHFSSKCRGIYMNSKKADNEDVSEDTSLFILITGCLD